MKNSKNAKRIFSTLVTLTMFLNAGVIGTAPIASAASQGTLVRLDPSDASDRDFEGWGTSLCWWANRLGYSESMTQQAAELFFSDEGLGLDIARYNLGGGDDPTHNHITRSDSKIPGYAVGFDDDGNIIYDWTVDQNQRNIALAALKANPDLYFEGFSNSPPYFMTNSGCSSGAENSSDDNLRSDQYDNFGKFIAQTTKHFKEKFGIEFKSYSPMNEPDTSYWGAYSPKQEGCHYSPGDTQSNTIIATRKALDNEGLTDVLVAGMDETSINSTVSNLSKLSDEAKEALGRIDTHTYSGSNRSGLREVAKNMDKTLWMSEVDKSWNGFGLADRIILDMNGMMPSAWVLWDIVDFHKDSSFTDPSGNKTEANNSLNVTGSLWGVAMGNHDTQTIELANKYYAFGQFTRYINPGDTIIASSNSTLAAYNKESGDIKIVVSNSSSSNVDYEFDLSAFRTVGDTITEIRSNNSTGSSAEHWATITGEATLAGKTLKTTAKATTITTYVISGAEDSGGEYAIINGGDDNLLIGGTVDLVLSTNIEADPKWSVDNTDVAEIDENGRLTIKKSGTVTVTAVVDGFTVTKAITIPLTISGGGSQLNLGDAVQLSCNVAQDYTGEIKWSVDNADVATIDENGRLTAIGAGTVSVTVTVAGNTATKKFVVNAYTLSGSASYQNNDATDYRKAADGDFTTYFDGVLNGWVMYNFGEPYKVSNIKLAARSGYEYRTTGAKIQASNDAITWKDLYTLPKISSDSYTTITANQISSDKAYRYYRYINDTNVADSGSANIAEFIVDGVPSNDIPDGDPTIKDIKEFTDNFEGGENIFGAPAGDLSENGNQIYVSGLERFGNVFVPANATAVSTLDEAIEITGNDRFRLTFNLFTGWESGGQDNTLALKDKDGNEVVSFAVNVGSSVLNSVKVNGADILGGAQFMQSSSGSKASNGWNGGSNAYMNNVGYNISGEIIIDGSGVVTVSFTGGAGNDIRCEGILSTPINIKALTLTGIWKASRYRTPSYDNFDGDIITYSEALATPIPPTPTPEPTDPPVIPGTGELINLNFDNGDLTSTSSYGKASGTPKFVTVDNRECIELDGTSATVVTLTDANGNALLTGQETFTISFKVKPTTTDTSWWFFAAPNASTQSYKQEKYLGAMTNGGTITVERYNNSGSRSTAATGTYTTNEWNDVKIVVDENITTVYVNGTETSTVESAVNIAEMLGNSSVAYIGLAKWGSGEYAAGYLDDFVITTSLNTEPTTEPTVEPTAEPTTETTVEPTTEPTTEPTANPRNPLEYIELGDTSAVKENIDIPVLDGAVWTSSDDSIVTSEGIVTRADETMSVVLTVSATVEEIEYTKDFTITVIGKTAYADSFDAYAEDGSIVFTSGYTDSEAYTFIVALKDKDGRLIGLSINAGEGCFEVPGNNTYEISAFVWNDLLPKHDKITKTITQD